MGQNKMKTYDYSISTNTIWTSFDYGQVEASNYNEAKILAIEKLKNDFQAANNALKLSINTIGFNLNFNEMDIQVVESEEN